MTAARGRCTSVRIKRAWSFMIVEEIYNNPIRCPLGRIRPRARNQPMSVEEESHSLPTGENPPQSQKPTNERSVGTTASPARPNACFGCSVWTVLFTFNTFISYSLRLIELVLSLTQHTWRELSADWTRRWSTASPRERSSRDPPTPSRRCWRTGGCWWENWWVLVGADGRTGGCCWENWWVLMGELVGVSGCCWENWWVLLGELVGADGRTGGCWWENWWVLVGELVGVNGRTGGS